MSGRRPRFGRLGVALAILVLGVPLVLPGNLADLSRPSAYGLPLEWPLAILLLVAAPVWLARPLALLLGLLLAALLVVKLADSAMIAAYGRHFDYGLDLHLIPAGWNLLSGSVGTLGAGLALAAGAAVLAAIVAALTVASALVSTTSGPRRTAGIAAGALVLAAAASFAPLTSEITGAAFANSRNIAIHWQKARESRADIAAFETEARERRVPDIPDDRLLARLAGKDVLLVFVESYGRAALDEPLFETEVRTALADAERQIAGAGLHAASGWLTSTTVGGQSWFAHATALSGLKVDSQRRYETLVRSDRETLVADFRRAGWRSVAVVPAISMAWPEGDFFGYDAIYDAHNLGYAGPPFNWVTMPDQYTLAHFQRAVREPSDRPVFAEIALISSHAPWTPIPALVDWDDIGDGRIFDRFAGAGDPPEVLWRDMDRVRVAYRRSLDYVIRTLSSYAARHGGDDLVMIVLGDHQAAPIITGDRSGRDVPLHVVAGDPAIAAAVARWGLTPGMIPAGDAPSIPMQDLRRLMLDTFSEPDAAAPVSAAAPHVSVGQSIR